MLLLFLVMSIVFWGKKKFRLIALSAVFLFLGIWRFGISEEVIDKYHIAYYANQNFKITGTIVREPDVRSTNRKITVRPDDYSGLILVNAPNFPEYEFGDRVKVKCMFEKPGVIEEFDYGQYLSVSGIYSVCYRPEYINHMGESELSTGQKIRKKIISIKYKYKEIIDQTISYPESEVLSAMTVGLRRGIPDNILDNFRYAGLSHIIAISGLHISIVTLLLMNFFIAIGLRRRHAFIGATASLVLFLLMIGFRASSIRAGIMGFAALFAMQVGRLKNGINILLLAAVLLLLINPKLLLLDVGFQLSFLAVLGIMQFGESIEKLLTKIKVPKFFEIRTSIMMTLSAQILVLPLIIYYFGNLSIVAPLSNVAVLPLLPFIMIAGFLQGIVGFIFLPLANIIGYLTSAAVSWIIIVADKIQFIPLSSIEFGKIDIIYIMIIYMVLGWLIWIKKYIKK